MVERRKIAVFDLDGTFYDGPSLRHFFIFGARTLARRGKVGQAAKILLRFAASKWGHFLSHQDMKHANCRVLEAALTEADVARFVDMMSVRINPKVRALLDLCRAEGYLTVLATASPAFYCEAFAHRSGFDLCTSTATTERREDYTENRGCRKLDVIQSLPGRLAMVVTDHFDDLPLLAANAEGTNYLVNPSAQTLSRIQQADIRYELL